MEENLVHRSMNVVEGVHCTEVLSGVKGLHVLPEVVREVEMASIDDCDTLAIVILILGTTL